MRTIFGLFPNYQSGNSAVKDLLQHGFDPKDINVIIQEMVAKNSMNVNQRKIGPQKSIPVTGSEIKGLERILGGRQPVRIEGVGPVYAAGELATTITRSASTPGGKQNTLKEALVDFDLPKDAAETFVEGIGDGDLLLFIRTSDEKAPEAAQVLRSQKSIRIASNQR